MVKRGSGRWEDAAKHPRRTTAYMFVGGLVAGAVIGYWRFDQSIGYTILLGVGCGLIFARMSWRYSHNPDLVRRDAERRRTRRFGSDVVWMGIGAAFLLFGAVDRNAQLVLAGLPLMALGAALHLLRRLPPKE